MKLNRWSIYVKLAVPCNIHVHHSLLLTQEKYALNGDSSVRVYNVVFGLQVFNQQREDRQKLFLCEDTAECMNVLDGINFKNGNTSIHVRLQVTKDIL